jgi:hypothetical protein
MTRLRDRKTSLSFVTSSTYRYRRKEREIAVEPKPDFVIVRLSGTRLRYSASWRAVYELAGEIFARQELERRAGGLGGRNFRGSLGRHGSSREKG